MNEVKERGTGKQYVANAMKSLTKYYTGKENNLDNASEMFQSLIMGPGLIVPANDILICKSWIVPVVFIQGKGKVNLIEIHECERGLIDTVAYDVELIYTFLKQYKTKGETKMKELEGFEILPTIEENVSTMEFKPLLSVLQDMKSGDILERESDGQGIILEGAVFSWYNTETGKRTGTIPLTTALLQSKFRILPKKVGWREAFEVYENGGTIGCEYKNKTVWFHRDMTNLEESSILADKQLDGLITTKWLLK